MYECVIEIPGCLVGVITLSYVSSSIYPFITVSSIATDAAVAASDDDDTNRCGSGNFSAVIQQTCRLFEITAAR